MPINTEKRSNGGIRAQVMSTAQTLHRFFQVRLELFALEAKEASVWAKVMVGLFCAGGVLLSFGYVMVICAVIRLLAKQWQMDWELVCLIMAVPHLLAGGVLMWLAQEQFSKPLFEASLNELEKDQEWLSKNLNSKDGRPS